MDKDTKFRDKQVDNSKRVGGLLTRHNAYAQNHQYYLQKTKTFGRRINKMNKEIMKKAGLQREVEDVESGHCPCCREPIDATTFRNELSLREFKTSGMCQKCQDSSFGKD